MASLKRANTWDVSDSEGEPDGHGPAKEDDCSGPHCEAEPVRLDSLIPPQGRGSRAPSVSPGRKRRTKEEREEQRARVEERRAERERAREEKRQEQQRRREQAARVRSLKPGELSEESEGARPPSVAAGLWV
ncbi:hypothetical protein AOLI_G00055190 [Acnodon oligacanthus]